MEENTKKIIIAAVIVIAVSMVSLNLGLTGAAVKEPIDLDITRVITNGVLSSRIIVELDYGYNKYSDADHTVYMENENGLKTAFTKCSDEGYRAPGSGDCISEIAVFDVSGVDYPRSTRTFSVKDTSVKKRISI